ncbi:hypothetical protein [uncultured Winogradskyella sp.]|uniref:hypothetical protein n=1 Tax=uncultured Winogradskyella sp. TaxID=395353 RepID=UPI0026348DCC|nr:hypothetical protein [uncultured Winogradskyella sp.]
MEVALLILFFILFLIYTIYSKSDLYAHEHDASIKNEIDKFNGNYKELENLDIEENYFTSNNHIY